MRARDARALLAGAAHPRLDRSNLRASIRVKRQFVSKNFRRMWKCAHDVCARTASDVLSSRLDAGVQIIGRCELSFRREEDVANPETKQSQKGDWQDVTEKKMRHVRNGAPHVDKESDT